MHGPETVLREEVTKALLYDKGGGLLEVREKRAFRYAACGYGDLLVKDSKGPHVAPLGCGHRLCPRCGRTKGGPMVKRVLSWLAYAPHGNIFALCLTQPVRTGETVTGARARLTKYERELIAWLKDLGMVSAVSVSHPNWSQSVGGWHFHVHLLIEVAESWRDGRGRCMSPLRLRAMYRQLRWGQSIQVRKASCSLVCKAGDADPSLMDGSADPDFWTEQKSGLAAAVQYPVRDIAQGISAKRIGGDREQVAECVHALLHEAKGWKLRRTYGQWRKKPPERPAAAAPAAERVVSDAEKKIDAHPMVCGKPTIVFGTVHRCSREAARGDPLKRLLFVALEGSCRNDTDFGKRFVSFCRSAASRGVT